jgi:hypothetical protein
MIIPGVVAHASRPVPTIATGTAISTTLAPTVTTSAATNFNQNSATLNGSTSIGTLSYLWGTSASPSTASSSASLTGLSNGTLYYFRAFGTNNDASASFTGTVTTTTPTTISFEYGTSTGVYTFETSYGSLASASNQAVSVNVSGLNVGTTYYYRIKASTTTGFVYGSENSFVAANAVAQGSVLSFTTYSYRTASFTSTGSQTWTNPVPTSGTNGLAITTINDCLIIGGGGSGSGFFGGGGGGQGRLITSITISGNVSVSVGASDNLSSLAGQIASPGNIGGNSEYFNPNGGTSGNGFAGGNGWYSLDVGFGPTQGAGGGGGGAGGAGANSASTGTFIAGAGGAGATLDGYSYGGGGGGIASRGPSSIDHVAAGGSGGGGAGNSAGTANTGGGGGGNSQPGGSGFVRFRYWGP